METSKNRIRRITMAAVFAALATVIMMFKFPLAVIAPPFYKLDFSETIALIAGLALGPGAAVVVELIKNLLNLLIEGTVTAGIGELANFLMGVLFVLPASLIFRKRKTVGALILGCVCSVLCLTVGAAFINYWLLIPAYAKAFGATTEQIVGMGTAINGKIRDLRSLILIATVPFNAIKGIANALLSVLIFKPLEKALERATGSAE